MGCKDLLDAMQKMSATSGDSESNSLWTVYYGQYLYAIYTILDACNQKKYVDHEEVFLPLCFLVSHYIELWSKTILKNFGIGDFDLEEATLVSGHQMNALFDSLSKKAFKNVGIHKKLNSVSDLYKNLQVLVQRNTPFSEAMRYPISKKDIPTLSPQLSDALEWQDAPFDFRHYIEIIEELMSETMGIYDLAFEERIH